MVLKHHLVRVSDGDRVFCPHDELVGVARVFVIVNNVGHENTELVKFFELGLKITHSHQVMHRLDRINYMGHIVVHVFFKIP